MKHRYAPVALAAALFSTPVLAQDGINPNLGYYYWDLVGIQGLETRTIDGGAPQEWEFNTTRMEYVYDFCGKTNSFIGFSVSRQKRQNITLVDGAQVHLHADQGTRSTFGEIYFGHHFTSNDFADIYFKFGQIRAEGNFLEFWGEEFEVRNMFELGFRSRVGDRRNLELVQKTRYDELQTLQLEVGFLYHSAAGFSFGISYNLKADVEAENAAKQPVEIQEQDEATFTLRINI